jgi:hypothetical protein
VILVVVAFVLGFLIYSVADAATSNDDARGSDVPALALTVQDASPAP